MLLSKFYGTVCLLAALLIVGAGLTHPAAAQAAQIDCAAPVATAESTSIAEGDMLTPDATMEEDVLATLEGTEEISAPLKVVSFEPTDIHFNPDADKPFALITVYSLIFQNQLEQALHIEKPHFTLTINGVAWGELVSTDFQTGVLQPHATQGIVLQNLTIIAKTTAEQQAILPCLKSEQPVDLTLTGTLDASPNGTKVIVPLTITTAQVVVRKHA